MTPFHEFTPRQGAGLPADQRVILGLSWDELPASLSLQLHYEHFRYVPSSLLEVIDPIIGIPQ
jgi:hypothetical protein